MSSNPSLASFVYMHRYRARKKYVDLEETKRSIEAELS